jgi:EAL domain-containing protein (putative c-di-GMP-specific phosphodiesterase class I)/ActR/RegA family two-component response regulator
MVSSSKVRTCGSNDGRVAYVLDDEVQIGAFVCEVLAANGFVARQFADPVAFLAEVRADTPQLAVVDLALGRFDAVDVIRQLEAVRYKGRVLLISGREQSMLSEIKQIGERHGLAMLTPLKKPFRAGDLKLRLSDIHTNDAPAEGRSTPTGMAQSSGGVQRTLDIDIEEALEKRWLELWYQPKIDLKSLAICGAEALLRARHPKYGIVAPIDLLPPAGDPRYQPLSKFVIRRALADWQLLVDGPHLPILLSVNVPVSVVLAPDFGTFVRGVLPGEPRFPGLMIEITEDEVIQDREWVHEVATQLKLYNVSISIDDFGSAYSSLARLHDLPFSELKLDRSFVADCSSNPLKHGLCRTVVDLARHFGAAICAEGVENPEDLRALIDMGCDSAQGFLFARPMPFDEFADMLRRGEWVLPFEQLAPPVDRKTSLARMAREGQRKK